MGKYVEDEERLGLVFKGKKDTGSRREYNGLMLGGGDNNNKKLGCT